MGANNFAVFRVEKIKTFSALAAMQRHWNRDTPTPNVDPIKTKYNTYYHGTKEVVKSVRAKLDEKGIVKLRTNGVLALEFILTFSHEFLYEEGTDKLLPNAKESYRRWLISAVNWAKKTYGERLISLEVHLDERTPHIHFLVLPIDTSRSGKNVLNARGITGGAKKLRAIQDSYANAVAHCGLRRGVKGSTAKHTTIREFSNALSQGNKLAKKIGYSKPPKHPAKFNDWNKNIAALEAALTIKNQLESDEVRSFIDELIATNQKLVNELHSLKSQQNPDSFRPKV
jgi:hypothetical protein